MKFVFGVLFLFCQLIGPLRPILAADSKASWQSEWNQTVRAAEQEGQVMVSIGGFWAIFYFGGVLKNLPKNKKNYTNSGGNPPPPPHSAGRPGRQKTFFVF